MTHEHLSLSCPEGFTFLTGGARSGKSRIAQEIASGSESPVSFLATAEALDEDMAKRIAKHQNERPVDWLTKEAPIEINNELESLNVSNTAAIAFYDISNKILNS